MAKLQSTYASLPATERGRGILIGFDSKSNYVAYCNKKLVILRSLDDFLLCDVYSEHTCSTTVARFSPNGEWVASGDISGKVRIWARGEGHPLKLEVSGLSGSIDDLQWSEDGQRIVVCGDAKGQQLVRAFLWDTGTNLGEFDGHSRRVLSCAFKPTRPFRIVTCGEDFCVNVYSGPPFRFETSHRHHSNFVNCVRYSTDGSRFVTVGSDRKTFIYDSKTYEILSEINSEDAHAGSIYAVAWSPIKNEKKFVTVSADKTAKVWQISEDGKSFNLETSISFDFDLGHNDMQIGCVWMPKNILTISLNGDMNVLSFPLQHSSIKTMSGHSKPIISLSISEIDGQKELFSASFDGVVVRWKLHNNEMNRLNLNRQIASARSHLSTSDCLIVSGLDDMIHLIHLPSTLDSQIASIKLNSPAVGISVPLNSPEMLLCATNAEIRLFHNSVTVASLSLSYSATSAAMSPDGLQVAVGSSDGKIHLYSVSGSSFAEEAVLEKHRAKITCMSYSPDGSLLASGDHNREAVVWDTISNEVKMKNLVYHSAQISCMAWSLDSSAMATGSLDTSIIVWKINQPLSSRITIRCAHTGGVNALVFKNNNTLFSSGDDCCIRSWMTEA